MKKDGFTLIELMIVIAIIGLLAAIALPRFAGVSDSAKVAQIQGDLSSIRTSISMFYVKSNSAFPQFPYEADVDLSNVKSPRATFTDFYSKNFLPKSPAFSGGGVVVNNTNKIYDARLQNGQGNTNYEGGWAYNVDNGDIFAAIKQGAYGDNTDWTEY